jgi:preprotein translocase subunit YajC
MLISSAWAQEAGGEAAADPAAGSPLGGLEMFVPLILIFVVFYFLLIRPQQRKMKAHRALVAGVRRGDRVVTQGGILGTVTKVLGDTEVLVEIAEGVRVRVMKHTLTDVLSRTEARGAEAAAPKPEGDAGSSGQGGGMLGRFKKSSS